MEYSQAIWNVGYVRRSGHIFLLFTLDKQDHAETHVSGLLHAVTGVSR
jgi:hypothetical protein